MAIEHSYCLQRPEKENVEVVPDAVQAKQIVHDHGYTRGEEKTVVDKAKKERPPKQPRPRKPKDHKKLQEVQNTIGYEDENDRRKTAATSTPYSLHSAVVHKVRDQMSEFGVLYEFLTKGWRFLFIYFSS